MPTHGVQQVRAFIAIPVPKAVIQVLDDAVKSLDSCIGENVGWVRTEGIHLTLKFMGNIETGIMERVLEAMSAVVSQFSPFELAISKLDVFPTPRRPRVLWSGVHGEIETLAALQSAIDCALGELGLRQEQRAFSPHLTLGRVRRDVADRQLQRIGQVMEGVELSGVPSWTADSINLMRTELDPTGSRHYLVGSASIGGS